MTVVMNRAEYQACPGKVMVLHPDERHNGRAGSATGFRYCMMPELESDAVIARLADYLVRGSDTKPPLRKLTLSKRLMELARAFLDAEFRRAVASEELETLTKVNRYSIAHHFRLYFGTGPYRYLMMRRLAEARRLIIQGQSP